jgi:MSHA biogenesis protein MshK
VSRVTLRYSLICLLIGSPAMAALDPTQPPLNAAVGMAAAQPLVLQAIVRGAGHTRAVINGQRLRVGDSFSGVRVNAIYPHAVLIERNGQQELLRLVEPITKPSR